MIIIPKDRREEIFMKSCLKARSIQGEDQQSKEVLEGFSPSNQAIYGLTYAANHEGFSQDIECGEDEVENECGDFAEMARKTLQRARISSCASSMQDVGRGGRKKIQWGTMQEFHVLG